MIQKEKETVFTKTLETAKLPLQEFFAFYRKICYDR